MGKGVTLATGFVIGKATPTWTTHRAANNH